MDLAADDMLLEFYTAREFHPAWTDRAKIEQLYPLADRAIAEGLDRTDYPFAAIEALLPDSGLPIDENARVALDILATETFVRIAYQLRFGKLNPGRLFADWNFDRRIVMGASAAEVVQTAIDAPSISRYVAEVIPRGDLYTQQHVREYGHRQDALLRITVYNRRDHTAAYGLAARSRGHQLHALRRDSVRLREASHEALPLD